MPAMKWSKEEEAKLATIKMVSHGTQSKSLEDDQGKSKKSKRQRKKSPKITPEALARAIEEVIKTSPGVLTGGQVKQSIEKGVVIKEGGNPDHTQPETKGKGKEKVDEEETFFQKALKQARRDCKEMGQSSKKMDFPKPDHSLPSHPVSLVHSSSHTVEESDNTIFVEGVSQPSGSYEPSDPLTDNNSSIVKVFIPEKATEVINIPDSKEKKKDKELKALLRQKEEEAKLLRAKIAEMEVITRALSSKVLAGEGSNSGAKGKVVKAETSQVVITPPESDLPAADLPSGIDLNTIIQFSSYDDTQIVNLLSDYGISFGTTDQNRIRKVRELRKLGPSKVLALIRNLENGAVRTPE